MVLYTNDVFLTMAGAHDTFPASTTKTGTITATIVSGRILGTSTLFTTELQVGGWICDIAHDEIRKITSILSNTNLTVDHPFSNALTSAALVYVAASIFSEIGVVFTGANGKINGNAVVPNIGISFPKSGRDMSAQRDMVDPIIVDATGTIAYVTGVK